MAYLELVSSRDQPTMSRETVNGAIMSREWGYSCPMGYDSPVGYGEEYFSKNISVSQTCKLKGVATFYLLPSTEFGWILMNEWIFFFKLMQVDQETLMRNTIRKISTSCGFFMGKLIKLSNIRPFCRFIEFKFLGQQLFDITKGQRRRILPPNVVIGEQRYLLADRQMFMTNIVSLLFSLQSNFFPALSLLICEMRGLDVMICFL